LLLLPALAVLGNANLYDGVRHLLFIYPPLALLAAIGLDDLVAAGTCFGSAKILRAGLIGVALLATLTLMDSFTLFPYAYVYVNEPMRFLLSPANTAYDYWVYAGSDAARGALRSLPSTPAEPHPCIARVELPDPMVLRLTSGAQGDQALCSSVTRWQWPWFRRTLSTACLEPITPSSLPR
jgi:hypothetical protein